MDTGVLHNICEFFIEPMPEYTADRKTSRKRNMGCCGSKGCPHLEISSFEILTAAA
jgi:hypothetical protein